MMKHHWMKHIFFAAGLFLMLSCARAAPANSAPVVWQAVTEYPASTMPGIGLSTFSRLVADYSEGALRLDVRFDDASGAIAILDAVKAGRVQVGDVHGGPLGAVEPLFNMVSLPFLTASVQDTQCLQRTTRRAYSARLEDIGTHLLYSAPWPPTGLWSAAPVDTMSDLRRLRVRTYDATSADVLASVGVSAVNMPFGEAMPRIRSGEINAVMSSGDGGAGRRLWENLRHFTALNYAAPLSFAVLHGPSHEQLPQHLKAAVSRAARDTEARLWEIMQSRVQENFQAMAQNGVTVHMALAPDVKRELQQGAQGVIADWLAKGGAPAAALLAVYNQARDAGAASAGTLQPPTGPCPGAPR